MQIPEVVIDILAEKSKRSSKYEFHRIYRHLYNPEFFYDAYQKIGSKTGNMTSGTDGETVDRMSLNRIECLIQKLQDLSYQPYPSKRLFIAKSNGKRRPLGLPSIDDKLVQEVCRRILSSIYEPLFKQTSHGFRYQKSCHTCLAEVQKSFTSTKWFIEGDIKGCFDHIDHQILIQLIRKKVKDEKFIQLLWKFLKAGYLENWCYQKTYSGTPQGGILSPLLANIYLHELDVFMEKLQLQFNSGKRRQRNPEYRKFENSFRQINKALKNPDVTETRKAELLQKRKMIRKQREQIKPTLPMDATFKRLKYVRYADDTLISVIGSKAEAESIKQQIQVFLEKELHLELSVEKTLITHAVQEKARFLGFDITTQKPYNKKGENGTTLRKGGNILLYVPKEKWTNKLHQKRDILIKGKNWEPYYRPELSSLDDLEILSTYDNELRGFYEYYKIANNVSVLNKMAYFMEYSMYKTFAYKYRTSIKKIRKRYDKKGIFTVEYETKDGIKKRYLISSFRKQSVWTSRKRLVKDEIPNTMKFTGRNSLIERLKQEKCEYCGAQNVPLEMHHVRKLKELKQKKHLSLWAYHMIARNRKTMALCAHGHGNNCHEKLHKGELR